jgi:hypothetical protein
VRPSRALPLISRSCFLVWSLCYLVLRCVIQLVLLRSRSQDFKELEIVVLRTSSRYCVDRHVDRD